MVCQEIEETISNLWHLNTCCTNHMCRNKSMFSQLDDSYRSTIKLKDDLRVTLMGKRNIRIQAKNNQLHIIISVFYIP